MEKNSMQSTKVLLKNVRASYAHVFEPQAMTGSSEKPKYSVSIILPKDNASVESVKAAIKAAYELGIQTTWHGKKPKNFQNPLHDGDEEKDDDEAYQNAYYLNAKSSTKPGVVKRVNGKNVTIDNEEEFYSGCWMYATVTFYPYSFAGKDGVGVGLDNILKIKDGDYLGGRSSAENDFADVDIKDTEEAFDDIDNNDDCPY